MVGPSTHRLGSGPPIPSLARLRTGPIRMRSLPAAASNRGRYAVVTAGVVAISFAALGRSAEAASPGPEVDSVSGREEDDLELFEQLLFEAGVPAAFRQQAAARIAREGSDRAAEILDRAIRGEEPRRQLVLEAFRSIGAVSPAMARMLSGAVSAGQVPVDSVALVFTMTGETATSAAIDLLASTQDAEGRNRLIDLLGRLADPMAPAALVTILQSNSRPEELASIDTSLRRWSNSTSSRTPAGWIAWWNRINVEGDGSMELRRLTNRIEREVARADVAEARAARLAERLVEIHQRWFAVLPEEERPARLVEMMVDEEPPIRAAAIAQVERLLRNGRSLGEGVRKGLLDRLVDAEPSLRIRAANVLDTIGGEDLGPTLVRALEVEEDADVVRAGLLVLGNRPQPAAADLAIRRLSDGDGETVRLAGRVLGTLAAADALAPSDRDRVREVVDGGLSLDSRELARLAVLVAADPGVESLVSLLASTMEVVQRGAAEAYRSLGRRELLHAHAANPVVARIAIQAWADTGSGVTAVSAVRLLELEPDASSSNGRSADLEADLETWRSAMARVLEAMPPSEVAEAVTAMAGRDELLENRVAALRRASGTASLPPREAEGISSLLIQVLLDAGRPGEAAAELRALGADEPASTLRPVLFRVLLRAEDWEAAMALDATPEAWLDAVETLVDGGEIEVEPLLDEIDRRFGDRLDPDARARLEGFRVDPPARSPAVDAR